MESLLFALENLRVLQERRERVEKKLKYKIPKLYPCVRVANVIQRNETKSQGSVPHNLSNTLLHAHV